MPTSDASPSTFDDSPPTPDPNPSAKDPVSDQETQDETAPPTLTQRLWTACSALGRGDQAELRRGQISEPFWRLLTQIGKEHASTDDLWKWRVLIQCLAIAGYSRKPLGLALRNAKYSEARFKRLLEAEEDLLPGILRRTAQQLKSAKKTGDWNIIRRLLFDFNGTDAETARLRLAQQFYTYTDVSDDASNTHE